MPGADRKVGCPNRPESPSIAERFPAGEKVSRRVRVIAPWFLIRPLVPILILLIVGELFTSGCAARRGVAFEPQEFDRARLEQEFPPGANVVVERHSGSVDRGSVVAFRDSAVILEFRSRELVGHPDTMSVPFRDIRAVQLAGPNPVRSISAMGVGLMIVIFGLVAAVLVFGLEPIIAYPG